MKTITEIQKYGLNTFITHETEIVVSEKSKSAISPQFEGIKKFNIEDVCAKLKNDLKWFRDDVLNSNQKQNARNIQENIMTRKFSEKTASKLIEEWWLGS
jgi:hypothetical protein